MLAPELCAATAFSTSGGRSERVIRFSCAKAERARDRLATARVQLLVKCASISPLPQEYAAQCEEKLKAVPKVQISKHYESLVKTG
jgi:hypothetical protein